MQNKEIKDVKISNEITPEFSNAGVLHVKKDSTILGFNQSALQILNYPADFSLSNRSFMDVCISVNSDGWTDLLAEIEENSPVQFNAIFRTHAGEFVETPCLGSMELGASVIDLYLPRDANASSFISAALHKLEIYDAFFDTKLLDINLKDEYSRYIATSQLFDETFGLPRGHAEGKIPEDIFPKKFADHVASHDASVMAGDKVVSQIDVVPFTGKHLLVQKFPIFKKDESTAGIGVLVVDVTAMKLSEQRHIDAKKKYADYYDLSNDFLWETDETWLIRESNASGASSMTGIQFEVGSNFVDELKKHAQSASEVDDFVNALVLDHVKTEIFDLKSGLRIKLSVKPISENNESNEADVSQLIWLRILTVLAKILS